MTRADAQRAIASGLVRVEGVSRRKSFRLAGGEMVEAEMGPPGALVPDASPVPVRYEDGRLLVVSKPAGVVTHPTSTRRTRTLVNRLLARGTPLAPAGGADRPGIVHRLDAGTSGLMLVAKDDEAHSALSRMLRDHEVERAYLALVRGHVSHQDFVVEAPLARRGSGVRVTAAGGRGAETRILVRERLPRSTYLEARPRTGRTHQIRAHLSAVGHPILGDRRYGGGGDEATALGLSRPFLHSWRLGFVHPFTGDRVELDDPLPPDLEEALRRARER